MLLTQRNPPAQRALTRKEDPTISASHFSRSAFPRFMTRLLEGDLRVYT